jgi:hypothetical protein
MSRFAQDYADAEPLDTIIKRLQYESMMAAKSDIMDFGARLLASYRARHRSF